MDLDINVNLQGIQAKRLWWIQQGYLWDDEMQMPVHQAVVHKLCALAGRDVPSNTEIHHIDHKKHNNAPTNLILLSPIAHVLVHMATARWSGKEQIGNLCRPEELLKFLDEGRLAYLYAASLVGGNHLTSNPGE